MEATMKSIVIAGILLMVVSTTAFGECMDSLWRVTPGQIGATDCASAAVLAPDGNVIVAGHMGNGVHGFGPAEFSGR